MRGARAAALAVVLATLAPRARGGAETGPRPPDEPVLGISVRDEHRAYPTELFATRRVINDVVGEMEVAVFHDPALGMATAWFRMVRGEPIEFSGEASGAVADDLSTMTRWDLATGEAVGGSLQGQRLVQLDVTATSWSEWTGLHPGAQAFGDGS